MPILFPKYDQPRSHLVIPDSHAYARDNFRRFDWLGQLIVERLPEVIVHLGDAWDMESLCSFDKGKKEFVFKNTKDDIESGHHAEALTFGPMLSMNERLVKAHKKQYDPIIIKLLGNHEDRVRRLLDYEPRWEGSVSMSDFKTRLPINETIVDYQDMVIIDGICYSHFFASGVQGRPFASARAMLAKKGMSCTMGHTHTLDTASLTKPTGEMARALVAGSFHDPDHKSFAGVQVDSIWWNGIFMKHEVQNGNYSLEELDVNRLRKMYEKKHEPKLSVVNNFTGPKKD